MTKKLAFFSILIFSILFLINYMSDDVDESYRTHIADIRREKVNFLKNSQNSPFKLTDTKFSQIQFFPINPDFKIRANLQRHKSLERVYIKNSDGTVSQYVKFAHATFTLNDQPQSLLILKQSGFGALPNVYFTAFADDTNGNTSYSGGRYLDLEIGKSDNIEIDFNLAYNPYCAYVKDYTCPLPPPENYLSLAITAGEKDYNH